MTAVAYRTKRDRKWDVSTGVCERRKVRYNLREGQYYERMANNNNRGEFLREERRGKDKVRVNEVEWSTHGSSVNIESRRTVLCAADWACNARQ